MQAFSRDASSSPTSIARSRGVNTLREIHTRNSGLCGFYTLSAAWHRLHFSRYLKVHLFERCHFNDHIMILRSNCPRTSSASVSVLLRDFLVPALSSTHTSRPFSGTSRSRSRIGSAPLSTPQGVDLRFLDPPARRKQDVTTTELPKTLEIVGPLGTWDPSSRMRLH